MHNRWWQRTARGSCFLPPALRAAGDAVRAVAPGDGHCHAEPHLCRQDHCAELTETGGASAARQTTGAAQERAIELSLRTRGGAEIKTGAGRRQRGQNRRFC